MEKIGVKMAGTFSIVKQVKEPVNLRCDQCSKTFTRSWLLKNHQRIHTGERPYQCVYCDKAFADKSNLRQHAKIHTTKEKLFQCTVCQKTFAQRRYLMKHATEIHRDMSMTILGRVAKISGPVKYVVQQPPVKVRALVDLKDSKASGVRGRVDNKPTEVKTGQSTSSEIKDKKYSEQDLKDFIKSNQKTMEKNGYIFIKQNFETLDTDAEPTLTEISEIPVSSIADSLKIGAAEPEKKTGNQFLKVNGKMVYLQMDNKPATREEILQAAKLKKDDTNGTNSKGKVAKSDTPGKIVSTALAKGSGKKVLKNTYIRRQANILKTSSAKRASLQGQEVTTNVAPKSASVQNIVKNVMNAVNPVQMLTMNSTPGRPDNTPVTYVQLIPAQGPQATPEQQQQQHSRPVIIPLSEIQPINIAQVINNSGMITFNPVSSSMGASSTNLQNVKITSVNNLNLGHAANSAQDGMLSGDSVKPEIVEIQEIHTIDAKGAAGDLGQSSVVANTPIVSDAPWQGVLNINSEQELLEYINSQSNPSVDSDQGYTILIQNVDSQNNAVMSAGLDSQSILTGSGHLSSVFTEQGAMIGDILPVVSNDDAHPQAGTETDMISTDLGEPQADRHLNGDETNVVVITGDHFNSDTSETELVSDNVSNGDTHTITVHINDMNESSDFADDVSHAQVSDIPVETSDEQTVGMMFRATHGEFPVQDSVDSPDPMSGELLIKEESESEALQESSSQEHMESDH